MRVSQTGNNQVQGSELSNAGRAQKAAKPEKQEGAAPGTASAISTAAGGANASISAKAKDFAKAKEVAVSAPEVREEKIAELKRRIAEGRYKVDAEAVANKMVDEHLKTAALG